LWSSSSPTSVIAGSPKLLNRVLARLVDAGVRRTRHEYRHTTAGADALDVLHALAGWGQEHTEPSQPALPMRVIHRACGSDLAPGSHCAGCERAVERDEIAWIRPWRSPDPLPLADPA
jgi:hypothetical protein